MSSKLKAWLAFGGVAFFWGTTFLAIKVGVETLPPFLMAGCRHFIGGIIICSFFLIKGYKLPTWSQFKVCLINGLLMLVVGNGLVTWAEIHISSGLAALICALTPLSIIAVNALFGKQKERLTWQVALGIIACLIAQIIIFRDNLNELANPNYLLSILFILIAIGGWGIGSIYTKNTQTGLNPFYGAGLQMITAGVILLLFGRAMGEWPLFNLTTKGIGAIVYLVVFGSLIGYGSYMYVLKQLPATIVSTYAYINTIVAVLLGWLWLDEKLNLSIGIAVVLTIAGVWLVNSSFNRKKSIIQ